MTVPKRPPTTTIIPSPERGAFYTFLLDRLDTLLLARTRLRECQETGARLAQSKHVAVAECGRSVAAQTETAGRRVTRDIEDCQQFLRTRFGLESCVRCGTAEVAAMSQVGEAWYCRGCVPKEG